MTTLIAVLFLVFVFTACVIHSPPHTRLSVVEGTARVWLVVPTVVKELHFKIGQFELPKQQSTAIEQLSDQLTDELIAAKQKIGDLAIERNIYQFSAKCQRDNAELYKAQYRALAEELQETESKKMPNNVVPLLNGFANLPDAG